MKPLADSFSRTLPRRLVAVSLWALVASCSSGGNGRIEQEAIEGKVISGFIERAVVCMDLNESGTCDPNEPTALADSAGAYKLQVPKGSTAPLLAEVDARLPPSGGSASHYRMASPSLAYCTNITPFSTLVHLTGEHDFALAEELVRNALGLPPGFTVHIDSAPAPQSLAGSVAMSVTSALGSAEATLDMADPGAFGKVVQSLPRSVSDLPVLRILTKNGAPILSREVYVDATFELTNPAAATPTANLSGKIRGRGHSTWGQPKNPYKVQFKEDAAWAALGDVLGMKKNRNWALLADYFDRSLMRNKLAFSLGNSHVFSGGLKWTPSGQHLEVYLNGDYVGVYLLAEDIRIAPERLNIRKMSPDPAVNDVDGGYIVEVDLRLDCYNQEPLNLQLVTPNGAPFCIDTPDEEAITPKQLAWIKSLIVSVEEDIYARSRVDRINPASFADWYLLSELFRNNDAVFFSSDFMWKDTEAAVNAPDRLLNMGPIWDFDLSAGNVNYNDNWKTDGCWVTKSPPDTHNWYTRLFDNPEFLKLTLARWKEKRTVLETFINSSIDTYARRLEGPQQRNFTRWPILGMQMTGYYTFATHAEEVAFLKRFLNERMAWLDRAYESVDSFNAMCR